jgi:hypothetical protein
MQRRIFKSAANHNQATKQTPPEPRGQLIARIAAPGVGTAAIRPRPPFRKVR